MAGALPVQAHKLNSMTIARIAKRKQYATIFADPCFDTLEQAGFGGEYQFLYRLFLLSYGIIAQIFYRKEHFCVWIRTKSDVRHPTHDNRNLSIEVSNLHRKPEGRNALKAKIFV